MKPLWEKIEKKIDWLKTEYYDFDANPKIVEQYKCWGRPDYQTFIFL